MDHEERKLTSRSESGQPPTPRRWLNSNRLIILCAALGIVGALFLTGYSNRLIGVLPYLLLLACPFMHFFTHRGHGRAAKMRGASAVR